MRHIFHRDPSTPPNCGASLGITILVGSLLHFLVIRMLAARIAELPRLHPLRMLSLVLRRRVVAVFAIAALQRNDFSHDLIPSRPETCEAGRSVPFTQ